MGTMSFIVGFICFLLSSMVILTIQVRNSRRIKILESDLEFQKSVIEELNTKLSNYEQEKEEAKKGSKGKERGQQTP